MNQTVKDTYVALKKATDLSVMTSRDMDLIKDIHLMLDIDLTLTFELYINALLDIDSHKRDVKNCESSICTLVAKLSSLSTYKVNF